MTPTIRLPKSLLPSDGRFGSGPSKVRPEAVAALADSGATLLGTSHRQAPVRELVGRIQRGLRQLWSLPDDRLVVLGNGGSSLFWDVAVCCLVAERSQHLVFGEFSAKFAAAVASAPGLSAQVVESPAGTRPQPVPSGDVDLYALTHNETSTGVMAPVGPVVGKRPDALVVVDATSAAGALPWEVDAVDAYYFAPQKVFASDGGLWLAVLTPAAVERAEALKGAGRWAPASLDLGAAVEESRRQQTTNTPAVATLMLLDAQLEWILANGGTDFSLGRCRRSAHYLYGWADKRDWAEPFVADPADRSLVVGTIDLDPAIPGPTLTQVLRHNGIVDTEPYRKLGRNQVRIGMYPAVEPDDVEALTACIDYVVDRL